MTPYAIGYKSVTKTAGLEKDAGSRLRKAVNIIRNAEMSYPGAGVKSPGRDQYAMYLNKIPGANMDNVARGRMAAGHAVISDGSLSGIYIKPKYRGMGLGSKFRGELTRQQPDLTLGSGSMVTEDGLRMLKSMEGNGYNTRVHPNSVSEMVPQYNAPGGIREALDPYNHRLGRTAPEGEDVVSLALPEGARPRRPLRDAIPVAEELNSYNMM